MNSLRICCASTVLAAWLAAPTIAMAQDVDGSVQVGLGTSLFATSETTTETTTDDATTEANRESLDWGIGSSRTSLEIGYGTSGIVLGGFLQFGGRSEGNDANGLTTESSMLVLGPKADFQFGSGDFRPFIGGMLGVVRFDGTTELDLDGGEIRDEYTALGYFVGGRLGGRWFLAREVSIDPNIMLTYASVSGDGEVTASGGIVSLTGDDEREISTFGLSIGLGLSLWL